MSNMHRNRQNRFFWRGIPALSLPVVLSILLAACSLLPKEDRLTKPALIKPVQTKTVTVQAKTGAIEKSLSGSAVFESTSMAEHQFKITGGRVGEIVIRAGDRVQAGDVLIRLQMEGIEKELLQNRLDVEKKKLALDEAKETNDDRRIRIAELDLQIAQMGLDEVEKKMRSKELLAETDGVVVFAADMKEGDTIEPYTTLFTVAEPGKLRLAMNTTDDSLLSDISVGMAADIEIDDTSYTGTVVQTPGTAPYMEDARLREKYARTLYITMDKVPESAYIGKSASVRIVIAKKNQAVIIPKNGLRKTSGRTYVRVLDGESRRELDVQTGLETATEVEIIDGLEAGQSVIIR